MIQLSFQPAFDPYHAVFRILRLRGIVERFGPLHKDLLRILDFYLLFPFRIDGIRMLRQHRKFKKLASAYMSAKPYGNQPEDRTIFDRMEPMQLAALQTLASRELIDADQLALGVIKATGVPVPKELAERVAKANEQDSDLIDFLAALASDYSLIGPDGLKARTGLLEYRYDAV
jgi:hypothetical protein